MLPTATFTIGRPAPGIAVVTIEGDLDVYSAPDLRDTRIDLVNEARYRQVFDLSAAKRIDSTGLGVIVGALKGCRAHGGDLALVVPYEAADVRHALTVTGLAKTIPHADTLDAALGLLAPKPEPQDERPTFWPPQVGDVWLGQLDQPSPKAWVCTAVDSLSGTHVWLADDAYAKFGPLRLVWRDGAVVTAAHSSEFTEPEGQSTAGATATIIVSRSYSKCSACGNEAVPDTERHDRVSGFGGGQPGCSARFTAITAGASRLDDYLRAMLADMRPDLPIVEPHEAYRTTTP